MFLQSLSNYSVVFSITNGRIGYEPTISSGRILQLQRTVLRSPASRPRRCRRYAGASIQFLVRPRQLSSEAMRIFLTSMNRSIYNYLLYAQDLSLHKCCFQNLCLSHACRSKEEFFSAARQMIRNYCQQFQSPDGYSCHVMRAKSTLKKTWPSPYV